jgi:hypothetical protein
MIENAVLRIEVNLIGRDDLAKARIRLLKMMIGYLEALLSIRQLA